MDIRTRIENLLPLDILGITNRSFLSSGIKGMTWGWWYSLSQSKSSHNIIIGSTKRGPIRFVEMEADGIEDNDPTECDHLPGEDHIVWVGRHPDITPELRKIGNDYLNELLDMHLGYGFVQFADFITKEFGINLHGRPGHEICSMLPALVYDKIGVSRPQVIYGSYVSVSSDNKGQKTIQGPTDGYICPMNWQTFYPTMENISPQVIGPDVIKAIM